MSKFLQNLHVQIFKVCQKSKFQIKFERILSSHFRLSAQSLPTSLPPPLGPTVAHLSTPSFRPSLPRRLLLTHRQACPVSRPAVFFLRKPNRVPPPPPPTRAAAAPTTPPLSGTVPHFVPTHPSVSPPHRIGRAALMPPPPAARSPSPSGRLHSTPTPYKRARSSPTPHRTHPCPILLSFEP
jgi:hypothetical protein